MKSDSFIRICPAIPNTRTRCDTVLCRTCGEVRALKEVFRIRFLESPVFLAKIVGCTIAIFEQTVAVRPSGSRRRRDGTEARRIRDNGAIANGAVMVLRLLVLHAAEGRDFDEFISAYQASQLVSQADGGGGERGVNA